VGGRDTCRWVRGRKWWDLVYGIISSSPGPWGFLECLIYIFHSIQLLCDFVQCHLFQHTRGAGLSCH
jgi:hypothetical protein